MLQKYKIHFKPLFSRFERRYPQSAGGVAPHPVEAIVARCRRVYRRIWNRVAGAKRVPVPNQPEMAVARKF